MATEDIFALSEALAAFDGELQHLRQSAAYSAREVGSLANGLSGGLRRAFDGLLFDGLKLEDALKGLSRRMTESLYATALRPVTQAGGAALAQGVAALSAVLMPFGKGGAFTQGRVMPFAKGGIVAGATPFALRGGIGLMGEAGAEAILPLSRGADGSLGVRAQMGRAPQVVFNITTPDVQGFRRSHAQIAAQISRALGQGQRNR